LKKYLEEDKVEGDDDDDGSHCLPATTITPAPTASGALQVGSANDKVDDDHDVVVYDNDNHSTTQDKDQDRHTPFPDKKMKTRTILLKTRKNLPPRQYLCLPSYF
jgi:hypothetical protein